MKTYYHNTESKIRHLKNNLGPYARYRYWVNANKKRRIKKIKKIKKQAEHHIISISLFVMFLVVLYLISKL